MFQIVKIGPGYCETGVIEGAIIFNLILATVAYILIKKTDNWSWMDRFWGLMPIAFSIHFLFHPYHCDDQKITTRKKLMAGLIILWGLRLAHTLWRKGVYSPGHQDPRLTKMKKQSGPLKREILIIFFLCFYQPMLSMLMTSSIVKTTDQSLRIYDVILFIFGLEFILIQGVADNQQYNFQCQKKRYEKSKSQQVPQIIRRGFVTQGLWSYSRHPNYFGQMSFWWVIFLFSAFEVGLNIVIIGVIQYTLFFQFAIYTTEKDLLQKKYPLYKTYKQHVSRVLPLPNKFEDTMQKKI